MGDPVVHFEIGAAEHKPLEEFYAALFGWGLQTLPDDSYTMVDTRGGSGINGGIGRSRTGEPWATFYVAVDDLQATLSKVESRGGKTAVPITEVPGVVTFAMFTDPDGLLVGLIKNQPPPEGAQLGPSAGDGAPVDWFEVLGTSAERTQAFYTELFGWKLNDGGMPTYGLVDTQSQQGGIQGGVGSGQGTPWATIYASVPDVERTLARAEELGGTRVYGPLAVDDHMQTGAFRDPGGNVFGVYHHGEH